MLWSPGLVATCCGYSLVMVENKYQPTAESRLYPTCHIGKEQNNDSFGAFYFVKVDLACFAFLFLPPFTDEPLLSFVFFSPLLSAILLFLCQCCNFTWLICQLCDASWTTVCQITPRDAQLTTAGKHKLKSKTTWATVRTEASWVNEGSGGVMLMVAVCFARASV